MKVIKLIIVVLVLGTSSICFAEGGGVGNGTGWADQTVANVIVNIGYDIDKLLSIKGEEDVFSGFEREVLIGLQRELYLNTLTQDMSELIKNIVVDEGEPN